MLRLFHQHRLAATLAAAPFEDPRAHLALEAAWVRLRLVSRAARNREDVASVIVTLAVGEETYHLDADPDRAAELLDRRAARLRAEIDHRLAASPELPFSV